MDTLTHALVGIGIAGLAKLDPHVSQNPSLQNAIWWASAIGSQAPDFDIITRVKGQTTYLKQHRGFSHSLPSLFFIPLIIASMLLIFFNETFFIKLFFWSTMAVWAHVFMDLLTSYGTEAFAPLIKKKIAWDILMIIDIFIIIILSVAITIDNMFLYTSGKIFFSAFTLIALYILIRAYIHQKIKNQLVKAYKLKNISVIPSMSILKWQIVIEQEYRYILGIYTIGLGFKEEKIIENEKNHWAFQHVKWEPLAQTFIDFTRHLCVRVNKQEQGHLVELIDLRYRFKDILPFTVNIKLDEKDQVVSSRMVKKLGR